MTQEYQTLTPTQIESRFGIDAPAVGTVVFPGNGEPFEVGQETTKIDERIDLCRLASGIVLQRSDVIG